MKKIIQILILGILVILSFSEKSEAYIYSISSKGEPMITENEIFQYYVVDVLDYPNYTVSLKPLSRYWVNVNDPNSVIPISFTELSTNQKHYHLVHNQEQEIFSGSSNYSSNFMYTIKVQNLKGLKSGIYVSDFIFTSDGNDFKYTMELNIRPNSRITLNSNITKITFSDKDVFNVNSSVDNDVNTKIDVDSNTDWELYLDTSSIGNLIGDYSFRIDSSTGNIDYILKDKTPLTLGQNYLLARGKRTYDNNFPAKPIPTNLQVRYSLQNNTGKFFKEGNFTNNLIYRIEEK